MYRKEQEKERECTFVRNEQLESLLCSLNGSLKCAEEKVLQEYAGGDEYPLIFIVGPMRSGTTMFMQWLACTGIIAYPSNLLSRFYGAPVIGAQIQLMLTDPMYNFRDEILDFKNSITFESENGKTKGALSPNEFWYFWRRFLPYQELDWLSDEQLFEVVDIEMLVNELRTVTRVFQKPFAMKSMILNYNVKFLDTIFKKALFIQIKRDPVTNVSSILDARKRQLGSEKEWYSFKIPEYLILQGLDPITQSAGQLHYINAAVDKGIEKVNESRKLVVQYEDFCHNPRSVYEKLLLKLNISNNDAEYNGPDHFKVTRVTDAKKAKSIKKALSGFDVRKNTKILTS